MSIGPSNRQPNIPNNIGFQEVSHDVELSVQKQTPVEMTVIPVKVLGENDNVISGIHDALREKGIDMNTTAGRERISDVKYEFAEKTINGKTGVVAETYRATEKDGNERNALKFTTTFTIKYKDDAGVEQTVMVRVPIKTLDKQPEERVRPQEQEWHNYIARASAEAICRTYKAAIDPYDIKHSVVRSRIDDLKQHNITRVDHKSQTMWREPSSILQKSKLGETSAEQRIYLADNSGQETQLTFHEPWREKVGPDGKISFVRDYLDKRQTSLSIAEDLKKKTVVNEGKDIEKFDELEKSKDKDEFKANWNAYETERQTNPTYRTLSVAAYAKNKDEEVDDLKKEFESKVEELNSQIVKKDSSNSFLAFIAEKFGMTEDQFAEKFIPNFLINSFLKDKVDDFEALVLKYNQTPDEEKDPLVAADIKSQLGKLNSMQTKAKELEEKLSEIKKRKDQCVGLLEIQGKKIIEMGETADINEFDGSHLKIKETRNEWKEIFNEIKKMEKTIVDLSEQLDRFKPILDIDLRNHNQNHGLGRLNIPQTTV